MRHSNVTLRGKTIDDVLTSRSGRAAHAAAGETTMTTTSGPGRGASRLTENMRTLVCMGAVAGSWLTGACESRQDLVRQAEARAKAYGYRAARVTRDVVYAQYGQRQLELDVYQPPPSEHTRPVPAIVVVRGGAFRAGDKEFFGYIAGQLAMAGFVAVSIEYRTADEATFPAAVHDVKAAVRWVRAHAGTYGVVPERIGAIGGSAGAHLIAMLATTSGVKEFEGSGGHGHLSSDIQAAVAMGGAYDLQWKEGVGPRFIEAVTGFVGTPLASDTGPFAAASPVTYVSSRSAPLLLLHSRTDPDVPFGQAVVLEERYRRAGASVTLTPIEAPGVHGFWGNPRYFPDAKRRFVAFFRRILNAAR
jgi:acetyl esterase/lipase